MFNPSLLLEMINVYAGVCMICTGYARGMQRGPGSGSGCNGAGKFSARGGTRGAGGGYGAANCRNTLLH